MAAVSVFYTPDDGRMTPETCRENMQYKKICILLHHVGVLFIYIIIHGNTKLKFALEYLRIKIQDPNNSRWCVIIPDLLVEEVTATIVLNKVSKYTDYW